MRHISCNAGISLWAVQAEGLSLTSASRATNFTPIGLVSLTPLPSILPACVTKHYSGHDGEGFPGGFLMVKTDTCKNVRDLHLGWRDPLEKRMATLSILARESHEQKVCGLQSTESKESNTTEGASTHTHAHTHTCAHTQILTERIGAPFLHIASICIVNAVTASSSPVKWCQKFLPKGKEAALRPREA